MIKLILFVKRKAGLSREAFRTYYTSIHAPLAARTLQGCVKYVRNFVVEDINEPTGYDVVTEFWFDHAGPWTETVKSICNADQIKMLDEDEANFMDRSSMRLLIVDEDETDPLTLLGARRIQA